MAATLHLLLYKTQLPLQLQLVIQVAQEHFGPTTTSEHRMDLVPS
jgi:hypothetical protein